VTRRRIAGAVSGSSARTQRMFSDPSPTVISLFSGAGGLDYGFEAAGFETRVALEIDRDCCATLRRNRRWGVIERSIFDVSSDRLLAQAGLKRGDPDIVIGGPPCQPFSKSGYWANGDTKRLHDPRADTLSAYLRIVEDTLPKTFLLENVYGIAYSNKSEGLRFLLRKIAEINEKHGVNYAPRFDVLKAADYGVPQVRERFFLVAARDGTRFEFPQRSHWAADELDGDVLRGLTYRTAWDAIGDVKPEAHEDLRVRGKWADLLASIPEGQNYLWHTDRGGGLPLFGWRRRFWTFLLKLAKNMPSWTLQAQPGPAVGPFHWDNRRLSMRELCRLQTFPDDVIITGTHAAVHKQVGNAVPSLLAEALAREIRSQLLRREPLGGDLRLMPPCRLGAPPPVRPKAVPQKYRSLAGKHAAHPGTGKGFAAIARVL
jgi:DNA (cytosine-5)-methyltransferase 1